MHQETNNAEDIGHVNKWGLAIPHHLTVLLQ